jgi:hypothetical protein
MSSNTRSGRFRRDSPLLTFRENGDTGSHLLPGDPGCLFRLRVAKEAGDVTEGEWQQLKLVHQRLAREAR